jgi:ferric-dicitrate binding protein FerR (iron transport regulator)
MNLNEARQFIAHFGAGDYAPAEHEAFLQWLRQAKSVELNVIADEHEAFYESLSLASAVPSPEWVSQLEQKLDDAEAVGGGDVGDKEGDDGEAPVKWMHPNRFRKKTVWIAAASAAVLIAGGAFLYKYEAGMDSANKQHHIVSTAVKAFVPRGGEQKEVVLADGSKVWLNSASSLQYPSSFEGSERVVSLSGEAFFEIAREAKLPFRVLVRNASIKVLGTKFNVQAYDDESKSTISLLDGAVMVQRGQREVRLEPGQQAELIQEDQGVLGPIAVKEMTDPDASMAWKNGYFEFKNDDLRVVMRAISRYYNVNIEYGPAIRSHKSISGSFPKKPGLANILEQLQKLNIDFTNDGKTVRVVH